MSKLTPEEKEQCVLRYQSGENIDALGEEYSINVASIYRWQRVYDGTTKSLEPKSSVPKTRHPKQMPLEEEQRIIEIVSANPQITDKQLSILLGTNRNVGALHRKRERLLGKRIIYYKYDYATLSSKSRVDDINHSDLTQGLMPNEFFVIEVVDGLFLQVNSGSNPVCVTPYFTLALKFDTKENAEKFLATLISEDMRWIPKIKYVNSNEL